MSNFLRGFLVLVSLSLFITSFYLTYRQIVFLQNAKRANGTIIDYIESCSSDFDNCDILPKIEFTTESGKKISFVNRLSSKTSIDSIVRHENNLKAIIPVLYNPQNPEEARIDSFMDRWFLPIFTLTTSFLLVLFVWLAKKR